MLSVARAVAFLVFALVGSAMAAPALQSLDAHIDKLEANVNEIAKAGKSEEVSLKTWRQSHCRWQFGSWNCR